MKFLAGFAVGLLTGVIAALLYERPEPETLPNFPEHGPEGNEGYCWCGVFRCPLA